MDTCIALLVLLISVVCLAAPAPPSESEELSKSYTSARNKPPMTTSGQYTCGKFGIEIRPNAYPERETGHTSTNGLNLSKLGVQPNKGPAYPRYVTLEQRLNTFSEWPRSMKQTPDELAAAGFFYYGKGDQTVCFHCGGGLEDWEDDDNPWEQHAKWFPKCNFVQKGPAYPRYVTLERRLNTFSDWPRSMKQKPFELAAAGFFYNGKGDQTVCFHCGGGLKDWEDDDNPWEQHAKWYPKCNFVRKVQNRYIPEVCSNQLAVLTSDEVANL